MKKVNTMIFLLLIMLFCTFNLSSQSFLKWEECATLESPTNLPVIATVNGKMYVVSGNNAFNTPTWEYDPMTDSWTEKAPIPRGCFWASAVGVNGKLYVMGGGHAYPGDTLHYIYDPGTDEWEEGPGLLTGRMYHSAAAYDGKIYLMGGQNGDGTSEWYFDEFDTETNIWTRKNNLINNNAWYCGAVGFQEHIYRIAGGGSGSTRAKDIVDRFNLETGLWEEMSPFPVKVHAPAAVALENTIVVIGGHANDKYHDKVYSYVPDYDYWEDVNYPPLPSGRSYHRAVVIDNTIYVYDGMNSMAQFDGQLLKMVLPTSVEDNKDFEMVAYPNPVNDYLNLVLPESIIKYNIEITDLLGNTVLAKDINNSDSRLDIRDLVSGIYVAKISAGSEVRFLKIIKK